MTTQHRLGMIERYDVLIENKREEIEWIKTRMLSTTISPDTEFTGKTNKITDKIGNGLVTYYKILETVDEYIASREVLIKEIEGMEELLDMELLHDKYVKKKSVKDIAYTRGYTDSYVFKLMKRAEDRYFDRYNLKDM